MDMTKGLQQQRHFIKYVMVVIFLYLISRFWKNMRQLGEVIVLEEKIDEQSAITPFQPTEEIDFPTIEGTVPIIPHIVHQIFDTQMIPVDYIQNIKSFMKYNPQWEYRFWTYESGRKLLEKFHPYLLKTYDSFGDSVMKSDVIRAAALYEFGGFYSDLDVEFLRPLDRVTMTFPCIMLLTPYEVSAMNGESYRLINGLMLSGPKHPLFKLILEEFKDANPRGFPGNITGPRYVTKQLKKYLQKTFIIENKHRSAFKDNSPFIFRSFVNEEDEHSVYIPNSQYFMDNLLPKVEMLMEEMCKTEKKPTLSFLSQRACLEFKIRKDVRRNKRFTFTIHQLAGLWLKPRSFVMNMTKINIVDIVPHCKLYD